MFHSAALLSQDDIGHGFFGRAGGVSTGLYASLNCGPGSNDNPEAIRENRARAVQAVTREKTPLVTLAQIHSADVITVTAPWQDSDGRPSADAMVTRQRNIALGILAADCCPVLLADAASGVVGAAHAGWRGALAGVVQNTVEAMRHLGARLANIRAAIGPTIQQTSYEVGPEVREAFTARAGHHAKFFMPAVRAGFFMFDLPGFVAETILESGVQIYENLGMDTYPPANDFFSYRRRTHETAEGPADYGRQISIICLR